MNARAACTCVMTLLMLFAAGCADVLGFGDVSFGRERRALGPAPASSSLPQTAQETPPASVTDQGPAAASDAGAVPPTTALDAAAAPDARRNTNITGDICTMWREGHRVTDDAPWTAGASECESGALSQAGVDDVIARITMYRAIMGLAPVVEETASRPTFMACAAVASWNPPGGGNPHAPPPTAKCYTPAGASGAAASNIGWGGRVAADAVDQYIEDFGNDDTFGHRRWLFNPGLRNVGVGFYAGGGPYGSAQCLGVFDGSGSGASPDWLAFPPPGDVPIAMASWTWSFHHKSGAATSMTVVRVSDNGPMPMTTLPLGPGYGSYGVTAFRPTGWSPVVGESYDVTVNGVGTAPIQYRVSPIQC